MRDSRFGTIIEPFRIHSVEPMRMATPEERRRYLDDVGWNLFALHADNVLIDLLTDSGTGTMSSGLSSSVSPATARRRSRTSSARWRHSPMA